MMSSSSLEIRSALRFVSTAQISGNECVNLLIRLSPVVPCRYSGNVLSNRGAANLLIKASRRRVAELLRSGITNLTF
jgi:hypothetical protein